MTHGFPSHWNMVGKVSAGCGEKALLKATSSWTDLHETMKVPYLIR